MKKQFIVLFFVLLIVSGLSGEFSIYESPNGHPYNPIYNQCENYNPISIDPYLEIDMISGEVTNEYVYSSQSTIPLHFWSHTATDINYDIWIDGEIFINDGYLGAELPNLLITQSPVLDYGIHNVRIRDAFLIAGHYYQYDYKIEFVFLPTEIAFKNQYGVIAQFPYELSDSLPIRPALFIEGFSLKGLLSGGSTFTSSIINKWSSLSALSDSKIYMLILEEPNQDARDNSMIVLGALRFIHNAQPNEALIEGTSVFGYSMGGILARYALAFAEHWNIPHYCVQYVSLDAPHRGAALNKNLSYMLRRLAGWMDDNSVYFNFAGVNEDMIDPYLACLQQPVATQLIRNNYYAGDCEVDYEDGTNVFLELYSEINEEERTAYGSPNELINSNPVEQMDPNEPIPQMKPGFPYKQNNIKCIAYSNGSLYPSGIHNNDILANYDIHIEVEIFGENIITSSDRYAAIAEGYDCQPGSVFEDFGSQDLCHYGSHDSNYFDLYQYYAPVLIPTISSLYLKPESVVGGTPNTAFNISNYCSISSEVNDFPNHTYFDYTLYADQAPNANEFDHWNWRHGELGWEQQPCYSWITNNITQCNNILNSISNRTIYTIRGSIIDNDVSLITGKMYINGIEHQDIDISTSGNYEIPYLYTNNAEITLVFEKPGCFTTTRRISYNYNYAMLHDYSVEAVRMYTFDLNNIIISQSGFGSFQSIHSAIDFLDVYVHSASYDNTPIRIKLLPDTYSEAIDLSPLADANIPSLNIIGWGDGVIINREVFGDDTWHAGIIMSGYQVGNLIIDNLTINHASLGVLVNLQNCNRVTISNCVFNLCSIGTATNWAIDSNVPTTIYQCTINDLHNGCIALVNNTDRPSIVTGCTLAHHMNAISITGTGHFDITNNKFIEVTPFYPDVDMVDKYVSRVSYVGSANIANNIFSMSEEVLAANCIYVTGSGLNAKQITINNNTFNFMIKCVNIMSNSNVKLDNNIFSNSQIGIKDNYPYNTVSSSYNLFRNVDTPIIEDEFNPAYHPGCLYVNEDVFDGNYNPIWTSTYMSPCIDAGTGENDPDGTPPDIGAIRAIDHGFWQYRFRSGNGTPSERSEPYHWVSYPVVNSLTQEKSKAETFFDELLGTHQNSDDVVVANVLHEILWYEGGNQKYIELSNNDWGPYMGTHRVSSQQGYKIRLLPIDPNATTPTTVKLHHSGFITPENTPFHLGGTLTSNNPNYENWIGYFGKRSAWPNEAFASIWNDITKIMAKTWCLYRDPTNGVSCLEGKMLPLNPGDMVIVKTQYDHEFQWNDATPTDPIIKEMPKLFSYIEKADYTPVYIDLSKIDYTDLKEIGLVIDGTCKGAVVVTDTLEQICAYLDDGDSLTSGLVELVFFYENKSQPQEMKRVSLDAISLKANHIDGNINYPVYTITILPEELVNVKVPVLVLDQNYPNPFNPSTSIRYSLDKSGPISLEIYNIRGQLVKSIFSGSQDIGSHTIIWDGRDDNGSTCSSGVYFYRLKTSDKTLVRKMLMLK